MSPASSAPPRVRFSDLALGALFFLAPLAFDPWAAEGFTLPKEILSAAALVFLLAIRKSGNWRRVFASRGFRWASVFTAWMFASSLVTARAPGEIVPGGIHWLLLWGAYAWGLGADSRQRRKAAFFITAAAVPVSLFALAQALGFKGGVAWTSEFDQRVFSTFGNPNFLAGYLLALLPWALVRIVTAVQPKSRKYFGIWTALMLGAFTFARVRGAYIGLGVGVLAALGSLVLSGEGKAALLRQRRWLTVALAALMLSLVALLAQQGGLKTFSLSGDTARYRLDTWRVTARMVRDHPWFGVGLGNFKVQYPAYQHQGFAPSDYVQHPYTLTEHTHNEPLQVWAEGGVVGLILLLLMVGTGCGPLVRAAREGSVEAVGALGGLAALGVFSLSNFPLQLAPMAVLAGWLLSATGSPKAGELNQCFSQENDSGGPLAWVTLGLVLLLSARIFSASVAYRDTLGETSLGHGDLATRFGTELVTVAPDRYRSWFAAAKAWEAMGVDQAYDRALQGYDEALVRNPMMVEGWLGKAGILIVKGKYQEAENAAAQGVALAPNYSAIQFAYGSALFNLNSFAEAETAFNLVTQLQPENFDAWINLGVSRVKQGNKQGAGDAWRKAFWLRPGDPQALQYLQSVGIKMVQETPP